MFESDLRLIQLKIAQRESLKGRAGALSGRNYPK